ncbi:MAG: apolipoprotein N-acyltransferase [Drouetiella hepatica Uher 2000/2452]|uniref:Apolipoprotein N-acyltransferase n=1 Tax=Drouetiella hepatica Uher 2000/2452 TaxID=904376 RepID=A0A951ULP1_9CYAN|nr:apolipoprotein N-acyltransferase [Drouetiella hepatica Uher 2000/2452]
MGLTPAPANLWMLAWVALAPLWILVMGTEKVRLRRSCSYALVWGIGYHGLALSWITGLHPLTWMGVPWLASIAITIACWIIVTLWGAAIAVTWAAGVSLWLSWSQQSTKRQSPFSRILIGTALWCAVEAFWSQGILYWTSLSYTQSPHNLLILHLGQLSGESAVTAAIVLVNACLAEAWISLKLRNIFQARVLLLASLLSLVSLHLIGWGLYRQPIANSPEASLKVGIIQGNVPTRIKLFEQGEKLAIDRYVQGYNKLVDEGVEAVLTPEGSFPWLWVGRPNQAQNPLYQAIRSRGVLAWVGTVGIRQSNITQTLFTITGAGEIFSRYDKVKLVPLGEYVPFEAALGGFIGRLSPVGASMLPGDPHQTLDTPFGQAIAGICYESAFPEIFRQQAIAGGQFILTASNNDPYSAAMMAQHHAQDVMRAVETDRWAVRATNTGFSGIVDPHGKTQWLSGFRTYETHAHTIYRRQTRTLYAERGDWLMPLLVIGAIGVGAIGVGAIEIMGDRQ